MDTSGKERRLFPRRLLEEEVYCYVADREKSDARSVDISVGGAFVEAPDEVDPGTAVALVFKQPDTDTPPVYLIGEVVRRESWPRIGLALAWDKAITTAAPEALRDFLNGVLGIREVDVEAGGGPAEGSLWSVYRFPRIVASHRELMSVTDDIGDEDTEELPPMSEKPAPTETREISEPIGLKTSFNQLDRLDVRVKGEQSGFVPASTTSRKTSRSPRPDKGAAGGGSREQEAGALTRQVESGQLRAPAQLAAQMDAGNKTYRVTISYLGLKGMFVQTRFLPEQRVRQVKVRFELRVKGGTAELEATCRIMTIDDGQLTGSQGLDLNITHLDEAGHDGILKQYVRWLSLRNITKR